MLIIKIVIFVEEIDQYRVFAPQLVELLHYHFRLYFLIIILFSSMAFLPEMPSLGDIGWVRLGLEGVNIYFNP